MSKNHPRSRRTAAGVRLVGARTRQNLGSRTPCAGAAPFRRLPIEDDQTFAQLVREHLGERRLVVVSHHEPVMYGHDTPKGSATPRSPDGLPTALMELLRACGGTWVTHGGGADGFEVAPAREPLRLRRARVPQGLEQGYYGLASHGLWMLCNGIPDAPVLHPRDRAAYRAANGAFARAVLDEVGVGPAAVFVGDHHLALLPRMLREARPDLLLTHLWCLPWPDREVMGSTPWGEELLDGLLGNDLLALGAPRDRDNFLASLDDLTDVRVDYGSCRATRSGRSTFVSPFPVCTDARDDAGAACGLDQLLTALKARAFVTRSHRSAPGCGLP